MKTMKSLIIFTDTVMYKLGTLREETALKNLFPMTLKSKYPPLHG